MADDCSHVSDRARVARDTPPIDQVVLGVIAVFMAHSIHVVDARLRADAVEFRDPRTGRVWEVTVRPVTLPMDPRD